nr:gfo/Idh/MocA family oxidoreductase [uncultured Caldimonas sp.]
MDIVSAREIPHFHVFPDVTTALAARSPDHVVIANATADHHQTLQQLAAAGFNGSVLLEKPAFDRVLPIPPHSFRSVHVGYNLRFHPVLQQLKELLRNEEAISVQGYVGQYLPDWRPGVDYRECYSAHRNRGGGVLNDLSHELDYLGWLFGEWQAVCALGGKFSDLEIDSEDVFMLLLEMERCPAVCVQMNYVDRPGKRNLIINTRRNTIVADVMKGIISVNGKDSVVQAARDESYKAMHHALLTGNEGEVCTLRDGLSTLRLIESARNSVETRMWVRA